MPELPEVETFVRILGEGLPGHPAILGRQIISAHLLWPRTLAMPEPDVFQRQIVGQKIERIGRRGKFLRLYLSQAELLIHLRMSGNLLVEPSDSAPALHHRLLLDLDDGRRLGFNDTRKFGRVWLTDDPHKVLGELGPEPLDLNFTWQDFHQALHHRRRQLKPLLLDQHFLAGLGNIYTDEALHRSKLHPLWLSDQLSATQSIVLLDSIRLVLIEGIRRNGTSIDWVYRGGEFQNYLRAYGQTGKPCPVCGTSIERLIVGQRSTHVCPICQPAPVLPGDFVPQNQNLE
jgi:formamidopyrimidine-DNA glycosylase